MKRSLILLGALAITWLVWSGLYKPQILAFGVLSLMVVMWLVARMDLTRREVFTLDLIPRLLGFWGWLLVAIIRSNLQVVRIILTPKLPISPTLMRLEPPKMGLVGRATLANSITLTPGTLTIDAKADEGGFRIHCLTAEGAAELKGGDMAGRVAGLVGDR